MLVTLQPQCSVTQLAYSSMLRSEQRSCWCFSSYKLVHYEPLMHVLCILHALCRDSHLNIPTSLNMCDCVVGSHQIIEKALPDALE